MRTQQIANTTVFPLPIEQRVDTGPGSGEGVVLAHAFMPDKYGDTRMVYLIGLDRGRYLEGDEPGRAFVSAIICDPSNVRPIGDVQTRGPLAWREPRGDAEDDEVLGTVDLG